MRNNPSPRRSASRTRARRNFPPARNFSCVNCGKQATEYDHYLGYGENWNKVEPVCRPCHASREKKRGTLYGPRKGTRKHIGPLSKEGRFLSIFAVQLRSSNRAYEKFKERGGNKTK